jgi:hypothetical protein
VALVQLIIERWLGRPGRNAPVCCRHCRSWFETSLSGRRDRYAQPPPALNMPTELSPTVPPNRLNHMGLDIAAPKASLRSGPGMLTKASAAR